MPTVGLLEASNRSDSASTHRSAEGNDGRTVLPRARGIVGPANSSEPVLKVFEVGLGERDRKRHHPAGASWFHNCLPLLMRFPFSLAKWPASRSCTAAFGLSRLNPYAPAEIKNETNRPQIANSGGFDLRKYSWKSLQGCRSCTCSRVQREPL